MNLRQLLNYAQPLIGLSPMDGITDEAFRLVLHHLASPDLTFTEFVSAEGISRGGVKLYDVLLFSPQERPIIGQLFGKDPESFYKAAIILCHLGFDGIDINMGCPAKTVTQHGSGAALIARPDLAFQIIKSVKQGIADYASGKSISDLKLNQKTHEVITRNLKYSHHIPNTKSHIPTLSVKTRLGIDKPIINDWLPILLSQNLDFITLHGRTLKQGYSGVADWELIKQAALMAHKANTKIFGNGDIQNRHQGVEYCHQYGVDGVLIGRAAMGNPWVFTDSKPGIKDKYDAMLYHAQIFNHIFPARRIDPLRKHFLLYSSGHPRAKALRAKLVGINSLSELQLLEPEFTNC